MSKISPMSEEEISYFLADEQTTHAEASTSAENCRICGLIFAWIIAQAKREKAEFEIYHESCWHCLSEDETQEGVDLCHNWTDTDWQNAVKARIGWRDE